MEGFSCQFEKCVYKFKKEIAVLYCDNEKIINKLTYQEVSNLSNKVKKLLDENSESNCCIGIITIDNLLLPSIILG